MRQDLLRASRLPSAASASACCVAALGYLIGGIGGGRRAGDDFVAAFGLGVVGGLPELGEREPARLVLRRRRDRRADLLRCVLVIGGSGRGRGRVFQQLRVGAAS